MKLWEKEGQSVNEIVDAFTVGKDRELDLVLAEYDLKASKAHARMLESISILTEKEYSALENALDNMLQQVEDGSFVIEEQFEDIHSKIEYELTQQLGDVGKKIHTGRSRNDQVLVCLHLYVKDQITEIKKLIRQLFKRLISLSNAYKEVIIPGYTHMQPAMPSSFGLWFGSYAETLTDDLYFLNAAYKTADQNPLGSAAGYGTSLPLDRSLTTELLGFQTLKYNVVAAQMSRGRLEQHTASAMASVAGTLNKLASDVCLYMSTEFGFLSFPDELTTGSSIMPHKKNPDVFELIRARCNTIQALYGQIAMLTSNLTGGYHRDFQLLKEQLFPAVETLKSCLFMTEFMLEHVEVETNITEEEKYKYIYSVEEVNKRVRSGVPFREAYQQVGKEINEGSFNPGKEITHTHEGSIGNLCNEEIERKFETAFQS